MHFTCRSFLGHQDSTSWSQFWENESDDPAVTKKRGHLFALAHLSGINGDPSATGHEFISEISKRYFSSLDVPAQNWLKNSLDLVVSDARFQSLRITLIAAIIIDGQLHIAAYNPAIAIIRRGQNIGKVLAGRSDLVTQISGTTLPDDQLFLCTPEFYDKFSWEQIKEFLALNSLQEVEENFLSNLYTFESQSGLSALLIQIHSNSKIEETNSSPPQIPAVSPQDSPPPKKAPLKISFPKFKLFSHDAYVAHLESPGTIRRKKINILLALVILSLLFGSVYFSYQRNRQSQIEKKYQNLKSQFTDKLNNAKAIKNLNLTEAEILSKQSLDIINQMSSLQVHQDEIKLLEGQATSLLSQTGSADTFRPDEFYDTTYISQEARFQKIIISKGKIYLLDKILGRIDSLDISQKSKQPLSESPDLKDALDIAENSGQIFVLKDKKVYLAEKKSLTPKIDFSSLIPDFNGGSIHFWNGSLYLLSQKSQNIWKFTPTSSGFLPGTSWLKEGQELPSDVTSFAINGDVWTITKNGTITPFSRGALVEFKNKTSNSLTSAANIVTAPDTDILAFTDGDNLVYVFRKTGESASKHNFDNRGVLSIALEPASSTVFVLCRDQKIYKIAL